MSDYCLVEVSQIDGVKERIMDNKECPLGLLLDLRKVSTEGEDGEHICSLHAMLPCCVRRHSDRQSNNLTLHCLSAHILL